MRRAWREADRAEEIREAARGWRDAALLDEPGLAAVGALHPPAGPQLGWTWRALVFVCVFLGVSTAIALTFVSFGVRDAGPAAALLLLCGLTLALVTDAVVDRCAFRPTGAEAATSLLAVFCLAAAAFVLNDHLHLRGAPATRLALAWSAAVLGFAAWRWGFRLYAGTAAAAALLVCAQLPGARLSWALAAALLAAGAGAALARRDLVPAHRGGLELARAVALAALYVAVNYYSVEKGLLEEIGRAAADAPLWRPGRSGLLLAAVGSALYPLGLLVWGVRARDRVGIGLGVVVGVLSLATLRFYVHIAPLWAVLALSGTALAGVALALEHWLRSGPAGERGGFTAAPLYGTERLEQLLPVAAALALAPGARALPTGQREVESGGGGLGGGGASGSY